ncbi:hypothetical protein PPERSA_01122 [Pseudocohnilembus persalinus]|uniref:Uncharacterized protein n=1 Tax=Pseudocohnilembus persalinus TaxID=266149 RepID=A0A0V0QUL3_PSEPJ|nr:hypothetical protein PPERSA_01122 [Pseudocohnilembus persalinus]|eukprot:KRX06044.1 hypothetical protein PPERSA_01122 [Pseudocohnilembus persalinus]
MGYQQKLKKKLEVQIDSPKTQDKKIRDPYNHQNYIQQTPQNSIQNEHQKYKIYPQTCQNSKNNFDFNSQMQNFQQNQHGIYNHKRESTITVNDNNQSAQQQNPYKHTNFIFSKIVDDVIHESKQSAPHLKRPCKRDKFYANEVNTRSGFLNCQNYQSSEKNHSNSPLKKVSSKKYLDLSQLKIKNSEFIKNQNKTQVQKLTKNEKVYSKINQQQNNKQINLNGKNIKGVSINIQGLSENLFLNDLQQTQSCKNGQNAKYQNNFNQQFDLKPKISEKTPTSKQIINGTQKYANNQIQNLVQSLELIQNQNQQNLPISNNISTIQNKKMGNNKINLQKQTTEIQNQSQKEYIIPSTQTLETQSDQQEGSEIQPIKVNKNICPSKVNQQSSPDVKGYSKYTYQINLNNTNSTCSPANNYRQQDHYNNSNFQGQINNNDLTNHKVQNNLPYQSPYYSNLQQNLPSSQKFYAQSAKNSSQNIEFNNYFQSQNKINLSKQSNEKPNYQKKLNKQKSTTHNFYYSKDTQIVNGNHNQIDLAKDSSSQKILLKYKNNSESNFNQFFKNGNGKDGQKEKKIKQISYQSPNHRQKQQNYNREKTKTSIIHQYQNDKSTYMKQHQSQKSMNLIGQQQQQQQQSINSIDYNLQQNNDNTSMQQQQMNTESYTPRGQNQQKGSVSLKNLHGKNSFFQFQKEKSHNNLQNNQQFIKESREELKKVKAKQQNEQQSFQEKTSQNVPAVNIYNYYNIQQNVNKSKSPVRKQQNNVQRLDSNITAAKNIQNIIQNNKERKNVSLSKQGNQVSYFQQKQQPTQQLTSVQSQSSFQNKQNNINAKPPQSNNMYQSKDFTKDFSKDISLVQSPTKRELKNQILQQEKINLNKQNYQVNLQFQDKSQSKKQENKDINYINQQENEEQKQQQQQLLSQKTNNLLSSINDQSNSNTLDNSQQKQFQQLQDQFQDQFLSNQNNTQSQRYQKIFQNINTLNSDETSSVSSFSHLENSFQYRNSSGQIGVNTNQSSEQINDNIKLLKLIHSQGNKLQARNKVY